MDMQQLILRKNGINTGWSWLKKTLMALMAVATLGFIGSNLLFMTGELENGAEIKTVLALEF
jgi:hypothetical protein